MVSPPEASTEQGGSEPDKRAERMISKMAVSMPEAESPPVERILFRGPRIEVGAFRCSPDHPAFHRAGSPIEDHHTFAFPRTRVWIRHEGQRPFATDLNVVTLYNPGQSYGREPLDPAGDLCEWFSVDNETAFEAVRILDPRIEDRPDRTFRFDRAPSDAATYLMQRELFEHLERGDAGDALATEERVLGLLRRVLGSAYRAWDRGFLAEPESPRRRDVEAAMLARSVLAARFREPLSLAQLAGSVGLSRYRLCHVFRTATGTTLGAYREQLRLRAALEELASGCADLTGLALDLGYSSHSHFSFHFRRAFGVSPSGARLRLANRGRRGLAAAIAR